MIRILLCFAPVLVLAVLAIVVLSSPWAGVAKRVAFRAPGASDSRTMRPAFAHSSVAVGRVSARTVTLKSPVTG